MGSVESRLEKTNWETADGGMKDGDVTLARNTPTHGPKTITMKKTHLMKHRMYDITDDKDDLFLQIRESPAQIQWFELVTPAHGSPPQFQLLARGLKKKITSPTWTIASYLNPAFPGQEADEECHTVSELTADKKPLYPIYELIFSEAKCHATISPIVQDPSGVSKSGIAGEPVLILEKVKSSTKQIYQTSKPHTEELASHWIWQNSLTEHKVVMNTAKGVDLSLHCILAALVNIVKETEKFPYLGVLTEGPNQG